MGAWPDLSERSGRRAQAFDRHYPDVYRFALALTGEEKRARDVSVVAFARCYARFDHLRDNTVLETSLLREVWRSGVPRLGRRAHVPRAAEALAHLGLPEAEIEAVLPSAREDMWATPTGTDEPHLPEVSADADGRVRALRGGTRRLLAMLVAAGLVGAATTGALMYDSGTTPRTAPRIDLPEVLPESYEPTGPRVQVVAGKLDEETWMVNAYSAAQNTVCVELRVGTSYGDVHCPSDRNQPVRAFVGPDRAHGTTFIYGYVRSDVTGLSIKEASGAPVGIEIGRNRKGLGFKEPGGFFAVTVPDYLLLLSSREQGQQVGYSVFRLRLKATKDDETLGVQKLLLGRPN